VIQPEGISRITSEVTYSDPTNSSITRHLFIPEGGIWIRPLQWWKLVPQWLWVLLGALAIAIIALATYGYMKMRRIKRLSSEVKYLKDTIERTKPIEEVERLEDTEFEIRLVAALSTEQAMETLEKYLPSEMAKETKMLLGGLKLFEARPEEIYETIKELNLKMYTTLEALKRGVKAKGDDPEELIKKILEKTKVEEKVYKELAAHNLARAGEYEKALNVYDSLIKRDPENLRLLFSKCVLFLRSQKYKEAIECYGKIIETNPRYKEAWLMKGITYRELDNIEEEERCYDKALEIYPDYAKALFNKARIFEEKGERENAKKYYEEAFKADPTLRSYRPEFYF